MTVQKLNNRKGIHAATMDSERLQRLYAALEDGEWHGSFELMKATNLVAVGSAISELRANGYKIEKRCLGQGKYEYRLTGPIGKGESELIKVGNSTDSGENHETLIAAEKNQSQPSDSPAPPKYQYIYSWSNNEKRETMKDRRCRIIFCLKMNSILIEFENGQREVISRNSIRKVEGLQILEPARQQAVKPHTISPPFTYVTEKERQQGVLFG